MSRIVRIVAFGLGLLGATTASQGPSTRSGIRQRLGGRDRQLRRIVERFDADARANGETIASAVERLRGNSDDIASRQGTAMQGTWSAWHGWRRTGRR